MNLNSVRAHFLLALDESNGSKVVDEFIRHLHKAFEERGKEANFGDDIASRIQLAWMNKSS